MTTETMTTETMPRSARTAPLVVSLLVLMLLVSACAAGANTVADTPSADGDIAGFWRGLWHGIIVPITFIISLFSDNVGVYEVHNNGGWYDLGFLFGAGFFLGGSGGAGASARR